MPTQREIQAEAPMRIPPIERIRRRSAAEVEAAHLQRGLHLIIAGTSVLLAVCILVVGGVLDRERANQGANSSEEAAQTIDYEQLNRGYTELTPDGGYYYNPETGLKETWYSQNVLPGGGLQIEGRHVNEEGLVCDGEGYIACASSDYEKGTIIPTSLGIGKVYDTGCPNGILDIYTAW